MWWWLACRSPEGAEPVQEGIPVTAEVSALAPVWTVRIEQDAPYALTLRVEGGGEELTISRTPASVHEVKLVGLLPGEAHTATATLQGEDGAILEGSVSFETEPVPAEVSLPFEVLALDTARVDPGWLLVAPGRVEEILPALMFDEQMRLRWWFLAEAALSDLRVGPSGTLWAFSRGGVEEYDWEGNRLNRWSGDPQPGERLLPGGHAHHELWPEEDGSFWTFGIEGVMFSQYPRSYEDPRPAPGETLIEDDPVLHIGADGTLLERWPLSERLDRSRIGFDSLVRNESPGLDWLHANGLVPDGRGGRIVSLRNQDAVVRFDGEGQLDWIFGDPLGWSEPFAEKLLQPIGEVSYPYHQHAPEWHPEEGLLIVFDNHFHGHTPYGPPPPEGEGPSRVVGYKIDEDARTVEMAFSFDETTTGPVFSRVMGDANLLPSGHILADYGFIEQEWQGLTYANLGYGYAGVRIVEFDPEMPDSPALDVSLIGNEAESSWGYLLYRARKIPRP